jgi:hypothetical protein
MDSLLNSTRLWKKKNKLMPILFKIFHDIEREQTVHQAQSMKPVSHSFQNWTRTQTFYYILYVVKLLFSQILLLYPF